MTGPSTPGQPGPALIVLRAGPVCVQPVWVNRTAPTSVTLQRNAHGVLDWTVQTEFSHRKRRGLFFTPWPIAEQLARLLAEELPDGGQPPTICDPFVGAGLLPAALVRQLSKRGDQAWTAGDSPSEPTARLLSNIYGVDLEAGALQAANELFHGFSNLARFDALTTPLEGAEDSWSTFFGDVFSKGGFDVVIANPPWEKARVNEREFFSRFQAGFSRLPRPERQAAKKQLLEQTPIAEAFHEYKRRVGRLKHEASRQYSGSGSGGDLDLYKLATERAVQLLRPGGIAGLIVPDGILSDWGARNIRNLLFDTSQVVSATRLKTGKTLFPEIHANLGVVLLLVRKGGRPGTQVRVSGPITHATDLGTVAHTAVSLDLIERATPHKMVPLVGGPCDVELLESLSRHPLLGEWPKTEFDPRREFDMTNDRADFVPPTHGSPLLEGKHLSPFRIHPGERRFDVSAEIAVSVGPRVAWRAVADRAMRRRLVAAWLPGGIAAGNSLICAGSANPDVLLYLLAWLNSNVSEAQLKLWSANNNINLFHIRACRVPRLDDSPESQELIRLAGLLVRWASPDQQAPAETKETLDDAQAARCALAQIDELWRVRYEIEEELWQDSVLARTEPVSVWPDFNQSAAQE